MKAYERRETQMELYAKLAKAEAQAASGETGATFSEFARKLRGKVHGTAVINASPSSAHRHS